MALTQCYPPCELPLSRVGTVRPGGKDYSQPLHVDCSVEYELPNAAKPPAGTKIEPLLMIHPCYYRRVDSQRQPFINNLPRSSTANRRQRAQPYTVRAPDPAPRPETLMALLWRENKRDPVLSASADPGVSISHWTDAERSPLAPLPEGLVAAPEKRVCPPRCDCGIPRYSHVQLQQWLHNVQLSISPAPAPARRQPEMMPLLIH